MPLQKVALLQNQDRLHFCLVGVEDIGRACQIAPGDAFVSASTGTYKTYRVEVKFIGGIFGSFMQWVVFDLGTRPVLVRKLNMELGTQFVQTKVKTLRQQLAYDR